MARTGDGRVRAGLRRIALDVTPLRVSRDFRLVWLGESVSLLGNLAGWHLPVWTLMAWVIVPGTIAPFILLVSALRHLPATRVGIIAMLEPVVATAVGWAWLNESLGAVQLTGALVVLAAIALAQTAR